MGYRDTLPALTDVAADRNAPDALRVKAIESLGRFTIEARGAVPLLGEIVRDTGTGVDLRRAAIKCLGDTHDRSALDALSAVAIDERQDAALRREAISSMQTIGSRLASPALLQVARSGPVELRDKAVDALAALGDRQALPLLIEAIQQPGTPQGRRETLLGALGGMGQESAPFLRSIVTDQTQDTGSRKAAFTSLASLASFNDRTKNDLIVLSRDLLGRDNSPESVRELAFTVVAALDTERGSEVVFSALRDSSTPLEQRRVALEAVKIFKIAAAEQDLVTILNSSSEEVHFKAAVAETLGTLDTRSSGDTLYGFATNPSADPVLRHAAIKALVAREDPRVSDVLLEQLQNRQGGSITAPPLLATLGEQRAVDPLIEIVRNPSSDLLEREAAIEALGTLGDPRAIPALVDARSTPTLRQEVTTALALLGHPETSRELQLALGDPKSAPNAIATLAASRDPSAAVAVMNALQNAHRHDFKQLSMRVHEAVAASGGIEAFATRLREGAGAVTDPAQRARVLSYADALQKGNELGIESAFRLTPSGLTTLVQNRLENTRDERPLAIVVYPREDHNGVFSDMATEIDALTNSGYRVMFYEVKSDQEAIAAMRDASRIDDPSRAQRADLLVVGGHGDRTTVSFGAGDPAAGAIQDTSLSLDTGDLEQLRGVSQSVADGGAIVLISCSNGEGKAGADNVANMMRRAFPHVGENRIFSAAEPTRPVQLILDSTGRLENVIFSGDEYRADSRARTGRA
jgi:HEAT repeat protein